MVWISNRLSSTLVHKDVRLSDFSLLGCGELHPEEILPVFSPQKLIESSVKAGGYLKLIFFGCSSSQIFTSRAQHPCALKLGGHPEEKIRHKFKHTLPSYEKKQSSKAELPRIIGAEGGGRPGTVWGCLCAAGRGCPPGVIARKHQGSASQSLRAGAGRTLPHRPAAQDTKQMHFWCVIRFSFAFTHWRSKHWHRGWKIAGSVLSQGFFDQRLHLKKKKNQFLYYASVHLLDPKISRWMLCQVPQAVLNPRLHLD